VEKDQDLRVRQFHGAPETIPQRRNPQTGKEIQITARRVLSFKPSQVLRKALNVTPVTPRKAERKPRIPLRVEGHGEKARPYHSGYSGKAVLQIERSANSRGSSLTCSDTGSRNSKSSTPCGPIPNSDCSGSGPGTDPGGKKLLYKEKFTIAGAKRGCRRSKACARNN